MITRYTALLTLCLVKLTAATAQTSYEQLPAKSYQLTQAAPAYKNAQDTLKPRLTIPQDDDILVIGKKEPGYVVVKRSGFEYYVPSRYVRDLGVAATPMQTSDKGLYFYSEVIPATGIGKAELYRRAKKWVATSYRSAQDVIQLDDPEGGELLVKGNIPVLSGGAWVRHMLTISVKEGRYRYDVRDFVLGTTSALTTDTPLEKPNFGYRKKVLEQNNESLQRILASLKEAMVGASAIQKEDW